MCCRRNRQRGDVALEMDGPPRVPQLIGNSLKSDLGSTYAEAARGKTDQTHAHFVVSETRVRAQYCDVITRAISVQT